MRTVKILAMGAAAVVLTLSLSACGGDSEDVADATDPSVESTSSETPEEKTDPAICSIYSQTLGEASLRGLAANSTAEELGGKYREIGTALPDGDIKDAWNNYGDYLDLQLAIASDKSKLEEFSEKSVDASEWSALITDSVKQCS